MSRFGVVLDCFWGNLGQKKALRFEVPFLLVYVQVFFEGVLKKLREIHVRFFGFSAEPSGNRHVFPYGFLAVFRPPFVGVYSDV